MTSIDTLISTLKLAGVILPPLGLLLLIVGLRGRRIGDAPHCRKCTYNLTGVPSARCPECGHDLTAPKATRIGQRRRRKAPLWIGALLLLIALAGWSGEAYRRVSNVDLYGYYPYVLLLEETKAGGRASLNEIERRYQDDDLTEEQIRRYVAVVLDLHAAPDHDHLRPWLDLLYQMMLNGDVTAEEEKRFYEQVPRVAWKVRKRIREGDPLPFGIAFKPSIYKEARLHLVDVNSELVELNGRVLQAREMFPHTEPSSRGSATSYYGHRLHLPILVPYRSIAATAELPPGPHELRFEADLAITFTDYARPLGTTRRSVRIPFSFTFSETFEVLPRGEPMIQLIDRPELKDDLQKLIQVGVNYHLYYNNIKKCEIQFIMGDRRTGRTLPVNVAFDAWVTYANEEVKVSGATCSQGETFGGGGVLPINFSVGDTVRVVLRPSPERAARTFDQYEIWNGELVYDNIEVKDTRTKR